MKRALILGVNGQDGFYLSNFLRTLGYNVLGTSNSLDTSLVKKSGTKVVFLDVRDSVKLEELIRSYEPHEIYNLAAVSSVSFSFNNPQLTREVNYEAFKSLLIICQKFAPHARIYQASSSEMFGDTGESVIDEDTALNPMSPYAESKAMSHVLSEEFREKGDLWIANGILFNHESPMRSEKFVSRKITKSVVNIHLSNQKYLTLGNTEISRDWGHASDYVQAMYRMMQIENPDKFVIATGVTRTLLDFAKTAFSCVGIEDNVLDYVEIDSSLFRVSDVSVNRANPFKANSLLNWYPSISFGDMIHEMVSVDLLESR